MKIQPQFNKSEVARQVAALSRAPFQEILVSILGESPDSKAIAQLAAEAPDKWSKMLATVAKLAGYADQSQVDTTLSLRVDQMSDSELMAALEEFNRGPDPEEQALEQAS